MIERKRFREGALSHRFETDRIREAERVVAKPAKPPVYRTGLQSIAHDDELVRRVIADKIQKLERQCGATSPHEQSVHFRDYEIGGHQLRSRTNQMLIARSHLFMTRFAGTEGSQPRRRIQEYRAAHDRLAFRFGGA